MRTSTAFLMVFSASTLLSAGLPAADLAFLRDTAITALTDADRKLQNEAILSALEDPQPQTAKEWNNPKTRASGRAQTLGNFKTEEGLHCRKLQVLTQAKGIDNQFSFPVCKSERGEWFIASGKKLVASE